MKTRKSRVSSTATPTRTTPSIMPNFQTTTTGSIIMLLLAILMQCLLISAERDFNVNDSQVPLLEPKDAPQQKYTHYGRDPYSAEIARCDINDDEILLSLVLKNQDWHDLTVAKLEAIQHKLAKFFALPKMFIFMESITKYDINEMQKSAIRKGNLKLNTQKKSLGRVSIMLGCDDKYFSMASPIINQIGQQMKDGSINEMTGENFGWWLIWRKQQKNRSDRVRRQAESSGDYDESYDDYDYGEDENVEAPTEIPPVTTHAHRHHHGAAKDENEVNSNTLLPPEDNRLNGSTTTTQSNDINSPSPAILSTPIAIQSSSSITPDTTTPTIITDNIEPKVENTPPLIRNRLQKLAITSGKAYSYIVPEETFYDAEDLTNLRLELTDKDGHELKTTSWIQFNSDTREIYALPLDDAVSKWSYRLSATDSSNETVTEILEISVQQHRGVRSVNHEISVVVKLNDKNINNIDWQLKLIKAIAKTLGDESTNSTVVREVRQTPQDPNSAIFVYFNETLPTTECPENELNTIVKELDANRLSDLVHPLLGIKSISGQLIGQCQKSHITKPKPTSHMMKNQPPVPRNQVDRVNATVGHLLVYKVPSDTFYDPNDNELTLSLKTKEHKEISPRHWLQFDSKNQEFYGIPKSGDIGSEEYLLVAEDAGGLSANDALVVIVNHAPKKDFSAYFKAYLGIRHEQFNADLQRKFVERVSQMFGDTAAGNNFIQIRSITTHHDSDSTIVNFYNTTLQRVHNRCPEHEIEQVRDQYLMDTYLLRDRVKKALGPELNLTNVQVILTGSCNQQTDITHREFIPTKTEEPSLKSAFGENYITTYIVPTIIIVSLIFAAIIFACCLVRCRRKSGKMELGDEEERKSFRTKGIPVIFQDELDEKPEIGNKSPIILKNEKPPLLPPSYNTSNMNGDNDVDEYVPPPAVIVGGREARGKSPATPSYRKPPPYVSP